MTDSITGATTDPSNLPAAPVVPEAPVAAPVVPEAPAGPSVGDLVSYRHLDTLTGTELTGAGVVLRAADTGSIRVAPLSIYVLDVLPELVAPLDVALLDVLA
jgi:hypothetical protein